MSTKQGRIRVLLAEEETLIRQCLRQEMEKNGSFQVVDDVADGQRAVEMALNHKADVILLNTNLPKLDGYQAAKVISSRDPDTKIILTTSTINDEALSRAHRSGAHGFLLRSATTEDLAGIIRNVNSGKEFDSPYYQSFSQPRQSTWSQQKIAQILTKREHEILHYLVLSNRDIATKCQLSECTVKQHVKNILNKLKAHNRTEAAIIAMESGLIMQRY